MSEQFPGERLLVKVLDDFADFMPYLVLVGGWVPYIYARYVWKAVPNSPLLTGDIDFGIWLDDFKGKNTITSRVQKLGYGERHLSMDRLTPFVPIAKDPTGMRAEVEFITDPDFPKETVRKIVGEGIKVNEIENFHVILESVVKVEIDGREVRMPSVPVFTFHKLLTFIQRENREKLKKDLYYAYYMLRFSPSKEKLIDDIISLIDRKKEGPRVKKNLNDYFKSVDANGPLYVEEENGPDFYVDDLREDIFERFDRLRR